MKRVSARCSPQKYIPLHLYDAIFIFLLGFQTEIYIHFQFTPVLKQSGTKQSCNLYIGIYVTRTQLPKSIETTLKSTCWLVLHFPPLELTKT
jgi:hypothetical protein